MSITRRDFLNGAALTIAAGLTPAAQIAAQPARYPPALTGLRGQHEGSFEVAHALAREGRKFPIDGLPVEETYDLVVVGGGISGLAAAWFYRRARPSARILILDNHDDFGGHAKRNEFTLDGRRIIGYGGSQSLQSPNSLYSPVAKGLLRDLGVDITRFETAFERDLYPSLGLSRGMFFNREAFGRDVLVTGDPGSGEGERAAATPSRWPNSCRAFRSRRRARRRSLRSTPAGAIRWRASPRTEKRDILKRTSYRDYLTKICGCSEEVANCFQGRPLGFFGLGSDAVPAAEARDLGYPGFAGLKLPGERQRGVAGALHLSFPRRQCVDRAAPGALAHSRRGAGQHDGRRRAGGVRLWRARPRRSAGPHPSRIRPASMSARSGGQGAGRLCPRWRAPSRRGAPCGARLLPHDDPAHRAGTARAAARGACQERQDADLLHQRAGAQLARVRQPQGQFDLGADGVPPSGVARFSGQPRRLPPSARSVRADAAASRPRARRAEPGARRARPVPHRAGQALCDDVCGFRGAHPRRSRPHARAGRVFQRARHRRDHRQPLAARLQLRGQFAVRSRRLRGHGAQGRAAAVRSGGDRQHRCRRRRLGALRHRSGRPGGEGAWLAPSRSTNEKGPGFWPGPSHFA